MTSGDRKTVAFELLVKPFLTAYFWHPFLLQSAAKTTLIIKRSTMKKTLLLIAIAGIIASCNQQSSDHPDLTKNLSAGDSIQLSDYNEWKAQQEQPASQQTFTSEGVNAPAAVAEP